MPGERRRAKLRALMPDHTGLDDDAPGIGLSAGAQPRNAASTMAPRALATRRPAATVTRLARFPANLCRQALDRASRALARLAAPSRPNPPIIFPHRHYTPVLGAATPPPITTPPPSDNP